MSSYMWSVCWMRVSWQLLLFFFFSSIFGLLYPVSSYTRIRATSEIAVPGRRKVERVMIKFSPKYIWEISIKPWKVCVCMCVYARWSMCIIKHTRNFDAPFCEQFCAREYARENEFFFYHDCDVTRVSRASLINPSPGTCYFLSRICLPIWISDLARYMNFTSNSSSSRNIVDRPLNTISEFRGAALYLYRVSQKFLLLTTSKLDLIYHDFTFRDPERI